MKETICFHAVANNSEDFENEMGKVVDMCENGGHEVCGVDHAVVVVPGDDWIDNQTRLSAIVWCQKEVDEPNP